MDVMYWKFPHIKGEWRVRDAKTMCAGEGVNLQLLSVKRWEGTVPVVGGVGIDGAWDEYKGERVHPTPAASQDVWDTQVGGEHYKKLAIQPMQYSLANGLDACQHTIIKYVTRFRDKAGIEDLEKAKQCIDLLIDHEREKNATEVR